MSRGLYIIIDGPDALAVNNQIGLVKDALLLKNRRVAVVNEPELTKFSNFSDLKISYTNHISKILALHNSIQDLLKKDVDCIVTHSPISSIVQFHHTSDEPIDYYTINESLKNVYLQNPPDIQVILFNPLDQSVKNSTFLYEAQIRGVPYLDSSQTTEQLTDTILAHIEYGRESLQEQYYSLHDKNIRIPLIKLVGKENNPMKPENNKFSKNNGTFEITEEGRKWLDTVTTSADGEVYALTEELGQVASAAAMARLSRRPGDLRNTLIEEFSDIDTKNDINVLRRIISDYGDDSVTQLVGVHYVVEGASNLLTKHIEWGRLASYLEQSTRYIYYDKKDSEGKYLYFRPREFDGEILHQYEKIMDKLFDNYSSVVRGLADYLNKTLKRPADVSDSVWNNTIRGQACDAARPLLPVATKSTVGIFASGQALENMIMRLRSSDLNEAKDTADNILKEARKIIPVFLERTDKTDRGDAYTKYLSNNRVNMQKLADEILPSSYDTQFEKGPKLTSYSPRNELDLVAHMLYEYSDMSENQLVEHTKKLTYDQKYEIMETYTGNRLNRRHKPGRALERAVYSWDILSDYGSFRDLQRHRIVSDLTWQKLTPRYGYDIPELAQKADLVDEYLESFDLSLELHGALQAAGYDEQSQYATLLGHNMRWKITMNAREAMHFMELRTSEQGHPGYRRIVQSMYDQLADVHPILASTMKFINQKDSPELTRLQEEIRNEKKRATK